MALFGADTAALRDLAGAFDAQSTAIEEMRSSISSQLAQARWMGPVAEEFNAQWSGKLDADAAAAQSQLAHAATLLRAEAAAQDAASAAEGPAVTGTPTARPIAAGWPPTRGTPGGAAADPLGPDPFAPPSPDPSPQPALPTPPQIRPVDPVREEIVAIRRILDRVEDPGLDSAVHALDELLRMLKSGECEIDELIMAVGRLSPEDAARLDDVWRRAESSGYADDLARLSSDLLAHAESADEVAMLLTALPALEPEPGPEAVGWTDAGNVHLPVTPRIGDINQGAVGDCWLLAGLGAQVVADPGAVMENIRENPNGTFTVTLYDNGVPTEITVSGQIPTNEAGFAAHADNGHGRPNWVSIWEKAAAQHTGHGDYGELTAGKPGTGIKIAAGGDTRTYGPYSWNGTWMSYDTVERLVTAHEPIAAIVLGSSPFDEAAAWHCYYVTKAEDGLITVRNPWGHGNGNIAEEMVLTEDQFNSTFTWASAGK